MNDGDVAWVRMRNLDGAVSAWSDTGPVNYVLPDSLLLRFLAEGGEPDEVLVALVRRAVANELSYPSWTISAVARAVLAALREEAGIETKPGQ